MQISAMQSSSSSSRTGQTFTTAQTKLLSAQYSLLRIYAIKKNCISWPFFIFFPCLYASKAYDQNFCPADMLLMDMIKYNHTLHPPIASLSTLPYEWRGNTHLCKKIWWHFVTLYFYDIKSGTKIISQSISSLLLFYDPPLDPNWLIKAGLQWNKIQIEIEIKFKWNTILNSNEYYI